MAKNALRFRHLRKAPLDVVKNTPEKIIVRIANSISRNVVGVGRSYTYNRNDDRIIETIDR